MNIELRRQMFHLLSASLVVASFFISRPYFLALLFLAFLVSSTFCVLRPVHNKAWIFKKILIFFHELGREEEKKHGIYFGAVTVSLAALMTFWIFGADIFRVAMLVLSFGDSFSTLAGLHFGTHKLFYNTKKSWEGLLVGTMAAFIACLFIVPSHVAIIAATVGMLIESSPVPIDDNLTIPFSVAMVMLLFL